MTLCESSVIYSKHRTRGIFIFLIVLSVIIPLASSIVPHLYPETGEKNITVKFEYKGAYERDIEKLINMLEQSLSILSGLESIYSVSEPEKGSIYCSFSEKTDFDKAYMELRDCVNRVYTFFPENVQRPVLLKSGLNNFPVFASSFNTDQFKDIKELERIFKEIKGCSDAETGGDNSMEIIIDPDIKKIHSSVFSFNSIIDKISKGHSSVVITSPGREQIKAGEKIRGVEDIKKIYLSDSVKIDEYNSITLRKKDSDSEGRINGEEKLILYAMKEGRSSIIEVCRDFKETAEKLGGEIIFNRGEEIENALLETALSVAAGITAVVITAHFLFRNISFSLLVILNILFSISASAAFLKITSHNLDIITLSGMAVVSGLAIDNSIIFLEKYIRKNNDVEKAIAETMNPLLFSLITSCVIFLPLVFASLNLKTMFSGMAVSVSSGLLASFLFTYYFVPLFLNNKTECDSFLIKKEGSEYSKNIIERGYGKKWIFSLDVIRESINKINLKIIKTLALKKILPFLLLLVLSFSSFFMFSSIEYRTFTFESSKKFTVLLEFPSGSSFQSLKQTAASVEEEMLKFINEINTDSGTLLPRNVEEKISLVLKTEKERVRFDIKVPHEKYLDLIKKKTEKLSLKYNNIYFHYPSSETAQKTYDITIYGRDFESTSSDAYRLGREIEAESDDLKAVYHFKSPAEGLKVVFDTSINSSILPDSGAKYIYTLLTSPVIAKYYSDSVERDIRFGRAALFTHEDIKKLFLSSSTSSDSKKVEALEDLADFVPVSPPGRIYHRNRQRSLSMSVTGIDGVKDIALIESVLSKYDYTPGCRGEGGVIYNEKIGERGEIILLISLSFFFIVTVLVIQFESYKIPFLITAGIPASFILPLGMIKLTGIDFTASTALALILSSGICVNNAILVLSQFKDEKVISNEMITLSLSEKTGAILAASFTTLLSVFPLIITGTDSLLSPFSIVFSAGIAGSLFILPVVAASCCGKR